jgi:hypothetical protein
MYGTKRASPSFVVEKQIVTIPSEVRPRVEEMPPYARIGELCLDEHVHSRPGSPLQSRRTLQSAIVL